MINRMQSGLNRNMDLKSSGLMIDEHDIEMYKSPVTNAENNTTNKYII